MSALGVYLGALDTIHPAYPQINRSMPLNNKRIKTLPAPPKPMKLSDGGGLFLLVTPSGGKHWRLKYRIAGREKQLSFGSYPDVSLAAAREQRDAARRELAAGRDPGETKREARAAAALADSRSVQHLAEAWLDVRAARWEPRHVARVRSSLERDVYPRVGTRPLADLKAGDWLAVLRAVEARGVTETAHRVLQRVNAIYQYALIIGAVDSNPAAGLSGALKPVRATHFKTVPTVELPALLRAIDTYPGEALTRWALQLAFYTFVRSGELRGAQWKEIDLCAAHPVWVIPSERMKMSREHLVPLSRQSVDLLREIHALTGRGALVFPSQSNPSKSISENTMLYALYRVGYHKRATIHGFRATASTLLNELGWGSDAIERQLAHAPADKVRAAYHRSEHLPERRRMMQVWADYLDGLKSGVLVSGSP